MRRALRFLVRQGFEHTSMSYYTHVARQNVVGRLWAVRVYYVVCCVCRSVPAIFLAFTNMPRGLMSYCRVVASVRWQCLFLMVLAPWHIHMVCSCFMSSNLCTSVRTFLFSNARGLVFFGCVLISMLYVWCNIMRCCFSVMVLFACRFWF